jgi:hypothetical protein
MLKDVTMREMSFCTMNALPLASIPYDDKATILSPYFKLFSYLTEESYVFFVCIS